jgi:hypothetical protein
VHTDTLAAVTVRVDDNELSRTTNECVQVPR